MLFSLPYKSPNQVIFQLPGSRMFPVCHPLGEGSGDDPSEEALTK